LGVTFLVSLLIFLGSYSSVDSTMATATMASEEPNQAAEFEPSVSMNDQNCRVFSCLAFDQTGLMQHSRTGGKVPWNALPALNNENADQNPEAGILPSRQRGSPFVNAPRLMSQLICPCTFPNALACLSFTCLLSWSLRRWGRSRNHFLRFCIMYGIITYNVGFCGTSLRIIPDSITDPRVSHMSLAQDDLFEFVPDSNPFSPVTSFTCQRTCQMSVGKVDHIDCVPDAHFSLSTSLFTSPNSGSSSLPSTQTAVNPAYGLSTTVITDTTPEHNGSSVGGMEAEPDSLVVQTHVVRTVSWWPSDEIVQASTQQPEIVPFIVDLHGSHGPDARKFLRLFRPASV